MGRHGAGLTIRIIIVGVLAGWLMVMVNLYMGLRTPFTEPGSILSALICFVVLRALGQQLSIHENNLGQTLASASGSIGNMVNVIPALFLLGFSLSMGEVFVWVLSISVLGVLIAIPYRTQLIEKDKLPFPTGAACADLLRSLHSQGGEGRRQGLRLGVSAACAGVITWFRDGVGAFIPAEICVPGAVGRIGLDRISFGLVASPMLLGVGGLVGLRIGLSMAAGAVIFWLVLPSLLGAQGLLVSMEYGDISSWIRWPGVSLLVASGLTWFVVYLRDFVRSPGSLGAPGGAFGDKGVMTFRTWLLCLIACSALVLAVLWKVLGVPPLLGLVSIVAAGFLAVATLRIYGETDVNLAGPIGHVSQFLAAPLLGGNALGVLGAGGVTEGAMCVAGDKLQDLKTGAVIGTQPKLQLRAQLIGVVTGSLAIVPVYFLLTSVHELGGAVLPAPSAVTYASLATALSGGLEMLPPGASLAMGIAAALGVLLTLLARRGAAASLLPSVTGLGVAALIPPSFSFTICLGALGAAALRAGTTRAAGSGVTMIASGLIAGESLCGTLVALLLATGVI